MNKKISLPVVLILVIVFGGLTFFIGYKTKDNVKQNERPNFQMNRNNQAIGSNKRMLSIKGNMVSGEIIKIDDNNLTIKLIDGGSRNVSILSSTIFNKLIDASKKDLTVGKNIVINGSLASDGSVMAQSIQIRQNNPVIEKNKQPNF